jgi:DNA-binding MarR family transcriptional regulator
MSAQENTTRDGQEGPDLGILLAIAYRCLIDELAARLSAAGFPNIRPPDGYMFRALQGEGRTSTELADLLDISKQATLKIIDSLEERGFVARHPVADDRRAKIVRLTERGLLAMQTAIQINRQIEAEFIAQIGAEDVGTLRAALTSFVETRGGIDDARARRARPVW